MKRIKLLIFLVITAVNTCGAAANNSKQNTALAVVVSKLQAKPMVFFNTERLNCEIDNQVRNIKKASASNEINDAETKLCNVDREFWAKHIALDDKQTETMKKYNQQKISADACNAECKKISDEREQLNAERNANIMRFRQQQKDVLKKITIIAESIAKRLGACGIASYNPDHYQLMLQIPTIACVDSAYDITDEVLDTLNKEYTETKDEKPKCNHCGIHCPHKQ